MLTSRYPLRHAIPPMLNARSPQGTWTAQVPDAILGLGVAWRPVTLGARVAHGWRTRKRSPIGARPRKRPDFPVDCAAVRGDDSGGQHPVARYYGRG